MQSKLAVYQSMTDARLNELADLTRLEVRHYRNGNDPAAHIAAVRKLMTIQGVLRQRHNDHLHQLAMGKTNA